MAEAATATWILTMLGGAYLFAKVSRFGRSPQEMQHTRWPSSVLFAHPVLAGAGFVAWLVYLNSDEEGMAWVSLGTLVLTALLGSYLWVRSLGRDRTVVVPSAPGEEGLVRTGLAEHELPDLAVHAHGAVAALTMLLVLLTALND